MNKQYHYIVAYDEDSNAFSIDWDTTSVMLEENSGTIFDKTNHEWEMGFGNQTYEMVSDKLNNLLKDTE